MQKQTKKNVFIGLGISLLFLGVIFGIFWSLKKTLQTSSENLSLPKIEQTTNLAIGGGSNTSENYQLLDKGEQGTEISLPTKTAFKMTLPKTLGEPVIVSLSDNRNIEILQTDGENFQALPAEKILKTPENAKLLNLIQETKTLSAYQTSDGEQTIFYAIPSHPNNPNIPNNPNSPATQWLFKNWTIYNAPPASRGAEAQPPLGGLASSSEITQTFKLKNATINLDSAGNANVFYGDAQAKNQEADFIIPRPYLLDKDGNKTDLNWKFEKETSLLSVSFSMPKTSFPLALDPSILKTDKAIATFSGKTLTMSAACGASLVCGSNCLYNGVLYGTVLIGSQCWMNENLRTDKYPDGTSITRGPVGATWNGNDNGYYAYPPNTANNAEETLANIQTNKLGFVYQWSAAMKGSTTEGAQGICPAGWHVPTDAQQYTLENYLKTGATCNANRNNAWDCDGAGTKLKAGGSSGFNAPLAGARGTTGAFFDRATYANLWSSSPASSSTAWRRTLNSTNSTVYRYTSSKAFGFSVRCLKN
jgi:uncharacterized protein (TIGR02145 family)